MPTLPARFGHFRRFSIPLVLGLLLRLWFVYRDPGLSGDPLLYGSIARNLLEHGVYGFLPGAPTLIRLPGYPLFLAACFRVFGIERYYPVLFLQVALDLLDCVLLSRLAFRLARPAFRERAARAALWLAALCPFTAAYTATPLTETLELLSITAALLLFARALGVGQPDSPTINMRDLAGATLAWIYAALLRPDGALLAVTLVGALALRGRRALALAGVAALASVLAFAPWALRNWYTFRVFQPLAPRYATDPGEPTNPGFQRWTKTVCADLVCTSEVYWAADDAPIDLDALPARAFDSPAQLRATAALLADYNRETTIAPALDARFDALARERERVHPVRVFLTLPLLRLADMWFRPRTELFDMDLRWWRYGSEGPDTVLACAFAALNLVYLGLAILGALQKPPLLGVFLAFVLLRCALLWTIEAPEPRYTLECYPIVLVMGGLASARFTSVRRSSPSSEHPA